MRSRFLSGRKKTILIIALGIFGTAAFAQNANQKPTNESKLKHRLETDRSNTDLNVKTKTTQVTPIATKGKVISKKTMTKKVVLKKAAPISEKTGNAAIKTESEK